MLKISLCTVISLVFLASGAIIPRDDPPFQYIPATGKPDNTFDSGTARRKGEPPVVQDIPPPVYGVRSIDLPFGRLYHGNMKYFKKGQLNTPTGITDLFKPGVNDFANQSACGIPDNAFYQSKVAIHPYFLKYADLSRYCMQDVCISFWKEDGKSDMILKVTDICDPADCTTPADIKVDRTKVQIMEGLAGKPLASFPQLTGDQFPEKTWWFFTKCWADALAHPAYQSPPADNWFTTPPLPNNIKWVQQTDILQWKNNQVAYKAKGWPTYPQGAYNTHRDATTSPPITDWVPGQEPAWAPIAGGIGWGKPRSDGAPSPQAGKQVTDKKPSSSVPEQQPTPQSKTSSISPPAPSSVPEQQPIPQSERESIIATSTSPPLPPAQATPAQSDSSIPAVIPIAGLTATIQPIPTTSIEALPSTSTTPAEAPAEVPSTTPAKGPANAEPDDDTCEA